jgi:hypothetical protein
MGTRSGQGLATLLAVGALASGCGGSGGDEPRAYALAPTRQCLQATEGVKVNTKNVDFVATTALGGAMRVRVSATNFVVMAFGDNEAEAQRIEQAYREFAGRSIAIDDVLERRKNLVLVWNAPPAGEEDDAVLGCLKGSG